MKQFWAILFSISMLSLSQPLCGYGPARCAQEQTARAQEHRPAEEKGHCCPDSHSSEKKDGHCPPSCHCACCHSPVAAPLVKHRISSFTSETAKPVPLLPFYHFDFQNLIWHPPQIG